MAFLDSVIDCGFENLLRDGFIRLPSIGDELDNNSIYEAIYNECGGKNFSTSLITHRKIISELGLDTRLARALLEVARSEFGFIGDLKNQYHISRFVNPGDKEGYRTHFDSHLFTLVLPIKIPDCEHYLGSGELLFRPNARLYPQNEWINLVGKCYYKRYAGKHAVQSAVSKNFFKMEDFRDGSPILFLGNTTLHTNAPVHSSASSPRLTLISHYFDPGGNKGIGSLLRRLRRR